MFVFWGSFWFFWGNEILLFCHRSGIHERKFTPVLFQEWYEYFLVQIKCSGCWKVISSYVWCCNIIHLSCYCNKNRTTGISFVSSSIRPNHAISEIATSHVYRLKKTRNESDRAKIANFLNQKSKNTRCYIFCECQVVEWLQWGRRSWNIPKIDAIHPIHIHGR